METSGFEVVCVLCTYVHSYMHTEREAEESTSVDGILWNLETFSIKEHTCFLPVLVPETNTVIISVG